MAHIVDLSHVIADGTITYPGLPGPVISDHLSREDSRAATRPGSSSRSGASRWCRTPGRTSTRRSTATPTGTTSPGSISAGWSMFRAC